MLLLEFDLIENASVEGEGGKGVKEGGDFQENWGGGGGGDGGGGRGPLIGGGGVLKKNLFIYICVYI